MKELLANLSERGIELWTDGEQIHYRGPREALTAQLLAQIKERRAELLEALRGGAVTRSYPLSHPQRALWYIQQSAPDSFAYNTAIAVRLRFPVDAAALRASLQAQLVRHPCLRTTFASPSSEGGLEPAQRVHAYRALAFEPVDASGLSDADLQARVRAAHERPFNLEAGPLHRASLFTRGQRDHVLLVSIHHIVCDGWSMWLLMDELWRDYAERTAVMGELAAAPAPSEALRAKLELPADASASASHAAGAAELERFVERALPGALMPLGEWGDGEVAKEALRARWKVLPKYERLFDALLGILESGRSVAMGPGGAVRRTPAGDELSPAQAGQRKDDLKRAHPELSAYVDLTWACLSSLADALTGKKSAMEVLFPDGSMDLVEKTYRGNRIADLFNDQVAAFVRSYVEERLRDPAVEVRILEVGAGTGGTSAAVLEALQGLGTSGRVKYVYTDVGAAFARYGERTFGEKFPFAEFKTLDLEQGPEGQGFEPASVDLVLGSHVLHATRQMHRTLRHLKTLLRKNGLLVLNELTRAQSFLTVTFGLMDGWWLFEDEALRLKGSPLLGCEQWRSVLAANGFLDGSTHRLSSGGAGPESPQTLIAAQSDGVRPARDGERAARPGESYESFVRWQRQGLEGPEGERHWAYWQRHLAGELPALDLPLDHPRPELQTYRGRWVPFRIDEALASSLRQCARERGVTLYSLLLAGYQLLLHLCSGQDDFVIGCPTAGREQRSYDRVVGHFVNTLPVRADLSGDPPVEQLIARTSEALLGALEHQSFPFPVMVERLKPKRDAGRAPVFQTLFVFQEPPSDLALADVVTDFYSGAARATIHGLDLESFPISQQEGQFNLSVEMTGAASSLKGVLKYNERLFDAPSMERMSRHYLALLQRMVQSPKRPIGELPLVSDAELQAMVRGFSATARDWPLTPVHALVEEQAQKTPDAPAVVFEGRSLSYAELSRQANQLARALVARGVAPEEPVGLSVERSDRAVVAILGILKSGAAYVPLDPSYPPERLAFMMDDAAIRVLVASDGAAGRLPTSPKETLLFERDWPAIARESGEALEPRARTEGLAYILYTSGSTGRPKGVAMPHGPLCNLVRWQREESRAGQGARTLQLTTLNFDVSFQEIFATLAAGGTLVVAAEPLRQDPEALLRLMRAESVERIFVPFVVLKLLADAAEDRPELLPASLKEIVTAGEQLRITPSIAGLLTRLSGCRLVNQYGPTEAHVVTSHTLEGSPEGWPYLPPIGKPIANTRILIVDDRLRLVPQGVRGELLIGGACVARGYYRQEELTEKRFIADPLGSGEKVYRTGDWARTLSDGSIEFLGRMDGQVKIHGFRIELAEVEKHLLAHPAVAEAAVICDEDAAGLKRLCAYYVRKGEVSAANLKSHLVQRLPAFMVPAAFAELSAIPLLPNKKVDRRALPRAQALATASAGRVAPRDEVEAKLVDVCREVLKLDGLGVEDNLFDLGVNSLTTLSIQRRIDQAYPGKVAVPDLLRFPTVAALAAAIRERGTAAAKAPSQKAEQYQRFLEALGAGR